MRSDKKILCAFLLNLFFSVFEFVGGMITGSAAIISDSIHDLGDALSIGTSYFLERKSKKAADNKYTYGYGRYSVLGGVITVVILIIGSTAAIFNGVMRIINPTPINYDGMIILALFGAAVNLIAAYFTRDGESVNQRAVNLHMLEDVLGWIAVLVGAVIMRFTDLAFIDPLMSIGIAIFILINAVRTLGASIELLLEKTPHGIDVSEIREHLCEIDGVTDVHHIHIWSLDETTNCATMHIVADGDYAEIKSAVRHELAEHGITHTTLELESTAEDCSAQECTPHWEVHNHGCHHHHGHGHHHHKPT
ncbi:MAG: cation transporter [Clostridia bacterium]|nr:cation transporter [Clostridia bacterium]